MSEATQPIPAEELEIVNLETNEPTSIEPVMQEIVKSQETEINELRKQIEENQGLLERVYITGQAEGWQWLPIWKSLMRDGYIQTIVGAGVVLGVGWVANTYPPLQNYQDVVITTLLAILGIQATGKQIVNLKK